MKFLVFEFFKWINEMSTVYRLVWCWSMDILCNESRVFHKMVMGRNRFLFLLKFIRFSARDLVIQDEPTRMGTSMAHLRENYMNLANAAPVLFIDEQLMLCKSRLHFRQYISTKRSRVGMKLFSLCSSAPEFCPNT